MSDLIDCTVTAPTTPVDPTGTFDLVTEATLVNNALVCHCVTVEIRVSGQRVNAFTLEVAIGGGSNPSRARVETPVDAGSIPSGDLDVRQAIVTDERGCGLWTCEDGAERGSFERLDG